MNSCPKHGTKYLEETEDGSIICMAPIPLDKFGLRNCYFEVKKKPGPKPAEVCSKCKTRKPVYGTLCKICRRENQKKSYHNKK